MVMPFGKLYALYDGKTLFITSAVVFMAASALCGAAPNMAAEVVGRVFAGAGGNGMYFGLLTLLSTHTTSKERPAYLGLTYKPLRPFLYLFPCVFGYPSAVSGLADKV